MIKLLKNGRIYAPQPLDVNDILVVDEKICRIAPRIEGYENLPDVEVLDLEGRAVTPAYIDLHVHITGGGGEQGPTSRVPESRLSVFLENGITTVVGLLGTDGVTRSLENLVAKARALTEEGMTAYALTSAYGYPPITMTGSVERDIVLVPPFIGVKVAVSDHRSSNPTGEELIKLACAARRAGLLSGTAGLTTMHMGAGSAGLDPVFHVLRHADVPAKNLLPTHMGRTQALLDQGVELIRQFGGYVDFTAASEDQELAVSLDKLTWLLDRVGERRDHVTLSSDAYGSQPRFDRQGNCVGLTYASPRHLHRTVAGLVERGVALEDALTLLTTAPAELLGKSGVKGCVAVGADADLLILNDDLSIHGLLARGRVGLWDGVLRMRGKFEE